MTSLAQIPMIGGVNRRSFLATITVVLIILGLFFIPEILSFRESVMDTERVRSSPVEVAVDRSAYVEGDRRAMMASLNPLDQVLLSLDTIDQPTQAEPEENTSGDPDEGWKLIHSNVAKQSLKRARRDALAARKFIPKNKRNGITSIRMEEFGEAVMQILDRNAGNKRSSAYARQYLLGKYVAVVRAANQEKLDRGVMLAWSNVSLVPVIPLSVTAKIMNPYIRTFRPEITLSEVTVNVRGKGRSNVKVRGVVRGSDVTDLYLLRNGVFVRKISKSKLTLDNMVRFSFGSSEASGTFTIRAVDRIGNTYDVNYQFLNRHRLTGGIRGPDPRIDAIYRVK